VHAPLDPGKLFQPLLNNVQGVIAAVSGGPDSMALLGLLAVCAERPPLVAATVDHGLRPESADEARMVAKAAARLGVSHVALRWDGPKPATGLQEAAREARYRLLAEEARRRGFNAIVTAHHADDQAETVLMRLIAGSGIAGLAGMRAETTRGGLRLLRPLLDVSKSALIAWCQDNDLPFFDDPSNADPRFGRARMRRILPTLAREGLTTSRLTRLAHRAAEAEDALQAIALSELDRHLIKQSNCLMQWNWLGLGPLPRAIRERALAEAIRRSQAADDMIRLERLERLCEELDAALSAGIRLRRTLAGRMITLSSDGRLSVTAAPARGSDETA
jgi:tRNA(Ile)-lysidine synthase